MWYILGISVAVILIAAVASNWSAAKLATRISVSRDEFARAEFELGRTRAQATCKHEFFELGQTGVPGIVTVMRKWCRVCGANLGPAKPKHSIFGKRWE